MRLIHRKIPEKSPMTRGHTTFTQKNPLRQIRQTALARTAMIFATVALSAALATDAMAAVHGSHDHGGHHGAGLRGSAPNSPGSALPPPTVNPSSGYTVPQSPETPVSPGGPDSAFGN
jgi:hypothetical protein